AVSAYLVGENDESVRAWTRAYAAFVERGEHQAAARCAFWLGFTLILNEEPARGGGWLGRLEASVRQLGPSCAQRAYLLLPDFLDALGRGDATSADALADQLTTAVRDCDDPDLAAFGLLCRGQASLALGDTARGLRRLDELMVSVTSGEVSPIPAGIMYCAVIEACMSIFELRRATEWTDALDAWCAAHPDLVPYRGQCLVHRSQILQLHGDWIDAAVEAERARVHLSRPRHPALGLALYQQGELHRLRGRFDDAERAYRAAGDQGRDPEPGLALLHLAEGKVDAAAAAIRRLLDESLDPVMRGALLPAAVEVLLAVGDVDGTRHANEELSALARNSGFALLEANADYAAGILLLAESDARAALTSLRRARSAWHHLGLPYESARARVQIAIACRALGDDEAARVELDAAAATFEELDAQPDLARTASLLAVSERPTVLTDRETEVLRLVATGKTNRDISAALVISEHTVARHVQNIFTKLGVSSRSAATAYAYEHHLV
ncbi:MAG: LuxR family transcriptional regulator, partial [Actinobacteria bacterium]